MNDRPLILITNDDGIYAKGLKELTEVMRLFGDVVVIGTRSSDVRYVECNYDGQTFAGFKN